MQATSSSDVKSTAAWRPYRDASTINLAEQLEYQYENSVPLDPQVVFEVLDRLLAAEHQL